MFYEIYSLAKYIKTIYLLIFYLQLENHNI